MNLKVSTPSVRPIKSFEEDLFETTSPENLPTLSGLSGTKNEETRQKMAEMGKKNLYFLCKVILGYTKLNTRVHLPMCRFADQADYNRRMMLMPRSHYKTTIWTISDSIQEIINNPNIRILMIADTGTNASRFMLEMQQHFQYNEVFRWVYPELIPDNFNKTKWNQNEMQVPRTIVAREPTVDAIGALGGSESRHYDYIKADDLITEKCIRSDVEMDKVIKWAGGLESLLVSQTEGRIDFVGSRKKKGDLYEEQQKAYSRKAKEVSIGPHATLKGELAVFSRSAIENGRPIFPENVSMSFLVRLREYDPERYHAQYANSPKGTGLNTFAIENLRYASYSKSGTIEFIHRGELLHEAHPAGMERIVLYDPSVAEKQSSSKQAIHVVAKGSHPFRVVLESHIGHYPPNEAIELLFDIQKRWSPSYFSIERRGFQGWVKYWLNEHAEREGLPYLPIVEWPPEGDPRGQWAKTEHIRGLQPIIRAGLLWVFEDNIDLIDDIEFYPNIRWDDSLDSLAQGLTYWPFSLDQSDIEKAALNEKNMLDEVLLGQGFFPHEERSSFDEAKFLEAFDATGYGRVVSA